MNLRKSGLLFNLARSFHTSVIMLKGNHYEALGISNQATQADVKAAYYKLSMIYHPDKSKGNEADLQKFRKISEAYEVLGNVNTRKLYDKGFFAHRSDEEEDINKFYKSREIRHKPPPPDGRTPIYNFDEWSKNHYGATFARDQRNKFRREFIRRQQKEHKNDAKFESMILVAGAIACICTFLVSRAAQDYDNVQVQHDRKK